MKKILVAFLSIIINTGISYSQAPEKINYQGVARDNAGNILANQAIGLRITLHSGSGGGPTVYQETQSPSTNAFGLFNIQIGAGVVTSGTFSSINWGGDSFFVQVEMDANGGTVYQNMGTSQLISVPYALYAKTSGTVGATGPTGPTGSGATGATGATGPAGPVGCTTSNLVIKSNGTSAVCSQIYDNGSFVGIGSTTPFASEKLQVYNSSGYGIYAESSDDFAILGYSSAASSDAIKGFVTSTGNAGNAGVYGHSIGLNGNGVIGDCDGGGNLDLGVWGRSTTGWAIQGGLASGSTKNGVRGYSDGGSGSYGGFFTNLGADGNGLRGECSNGTTAVGVWGSSTTGYSGYFSGAGGLGVRVVGNQTVTGTKSFEIDHPLDPANKVLVHSCIESNQQLNLYSGNVTTDESGNATVTLPHYFENLNIDFRYQLTVIGEFAQAIVSEKIKSNQFKIKTSIPNTEVSWMVTAVRNDAWCKDHPFVDEREKLKGEKGFYLYPQGYGQPKEMSIDYQRDVMTNSGKAHQLQVEKEKSIRSGK